MGRIESETERHLAAVDALDEAATDASMDAEPEQCDYEAAREEIASNHAADWINDMLNIKHPAGSPQHIVMLYIIYDTANEMYEMLASLNAQERVYQEYENDSQ